MIPPFLNEVPVVGILRGVPHNTVVPAGEAAVRGGIRALEVTMDSGDALLHIETLRSRVDGLTVGTSTAMSVDEARLAPSVGAQFLVCPYIDGRILDHCARMGMRVFPGP